MYNIKASEGESYFDNFMDNVDGEAWHAGFNMEVQDEVNLIFKPRDTKYPMPTITTIREAQDDGKIYYVPTMEFPSRVSADDLEYYDSFEYLIDKYAKAARFCTYLLTHPYDPALEYEDEY